MTALAAVPRPASPAHSFRTAFGPAWVANSAREVPAELRESAFAGQCKDFRFYELVEDALPGQFEYRYLGLENSETGEVVLQPLFFVNQDLLAGLPGRLHAWVGKLRRRWPRLLVMRMLMVGCVSGESHLSSTAPWVAQALQEALEAYRPHARASLILLKDFPAQYREPLALFAAKTYCRVPSMPGARLELDFKSFEEFLQERVGKVYRKNLRRKFREVEAAPAITLEVLRDAAPIAAELHALYMQTHLRSTMHFEKLTERYFAEAGQRLQNRVRFFIWRQEGRIIAFNFCMVHEGTLYDLEVGMDYRVALDLHLYFVTWRDIIQWSVENGVRYYHTGPLNYDPKLHLRLRLVPLDLYARHSSRWINPIFKFALKFLQPARHEPLLKRFPNVEEL